VFDGDLDPAHRKALKAQPPAVLFTNPEMLHQSFLGWDSQWLAFLRHLRFVVIDEIHEYRGSFGTNVALLLRRLLARLTRLGVKPQIVLATATCGNPGEHALQLTGRRCRVVHAETRMRPERHIAFIDPDIPDFRFSEVYRHRIVRAALACVAAGKSTLVFCPTRKFVEEGSIRAKREARDLGIDPDRIATYRSGYSADQRENVADGLRSGRYQAVFCTNALEIGIDIGRLDACILAGFPDSVLSAWQRIGRVGRSWEKQACILCYALNNPFDRFYANNIDAFLDKPLDDIRIGINNEELMRKHLPYLLHEAEGRLTDDLADDLGTMFLDFARSATAGVSPVVGRRPNYQALNLRGGSATISRLVCGGKEIGTISDAQMFREAFVGAIYSHFGKTYQVVAHGTREVVLEDADPHLRTEGLFYTVTQGTEVLGGIRYEGSLAACHGRMNVFENFGGYRVIDTRSGTTMHEERWESARRQGVHGFWLEIGDPSLLEPFGPHVLPGIEQLLRIGSPFELACDRHDLATVTSPGTPGIVYLYETVPGGIGIAEKALEVWDHLLRKGLDIAERCPCAKGCPSCIVPPRRTNGIEHIDKRVACLASRHLLAIAERAPRERFDPELHAWRAAQ
jgi:DEAD/DEAH box helicase domain-containing protein